MSEHWAERLEQVEPPAIIGERTVETNRDQRIGGATISGVAGFGAVAAGVNVWLTTQLRTFATKVADLTRTDLMNRTSAAIGNIGGGGDGSHAIREAHEMQLIESGEYKLAKQVYNLGGKHAATMIAGLGAGAVAFLGYLALSPKKIEKLPIFGPHTLLTPENTLTTVKTHVSKHVERDRDEDERDERPKHERKEHPKHVKDEIDTSEPEENEKPKKNWRKELDEAPEASHEKTR